MGFVLESIGWKSAAWDAAGCETNDSCHTDPLVRGSWWWQKRVPWEWLVCGCSQNRFYNAKKAMESSDISFVTSQSNAWVILEVAYWSFHTSSGRLNPEAPATAFCPIDQMWGEEVGRFWKRSRGKKWGNNHSDTVVPTYFQWYDWWWQWTGGVDMKLQRTWSIRTDGNCDCWFCNEANIQAAWCS